MKNTKFIEKIMAINQLFLRPIKCLKYFVILLIIRLSTMLSLIKYSSRYPSKLIQHSLSYRFCRNSSMGSGIKIVEEKRKMRDRNLQNYKRNLPTEKLQNYINKHKVDLTLYMQHDSIESQYIFNMLNIQKMGFRKISDYAILNQAQYALNIRKNQKKWPALKFSAPVTQPIILTGSDKIYKFLDDQGLIRYEIDMQVNQFLMKHIEEHILPALQLIFLHPQLTFEQYFYFDPSSYSNSINYAVVGSISKNLRKLTSKIIPNLIKLMKNKQAYEKSKEDFTKGMKQLEHFFTGQNEFIGGTNPSYMDIYLFSILSTKTKSQHFTRFLREDVGGKVWHWFGRMKIQTHYDHERLTLM